MLYHNPLWFSLLTLSACLSRDPAMLAAPRILESGSLRFQSAQLKLDCRQADPEEPRCALHWSGRLEDGASSDREIQLLLYARNLEKPQFAGATPQEGLTQSKLKLYQEQLKREEIALKNARRAAHRGVEESLKGSRFQLEVLKISPLPGEGNDPLGAWLREQGTWGLALSLPSESPQSLSISGQLSPGRAQQKAFSWAPIFTRHLLFARSSPRHSFRHFDYLPPHPQQRSPDFVTEVELQLPKGWSWNISEPKDQEPRAPLQEKQLLKGESQLVQFRQSPKFKESLALEFKVPGPDLRWGGPLLALGGEGRLDGEGDRNPGIKIR